MGKPNESELLFGRKEKGNLSELDLKSSKRGVIPHSTATTAGYFLVNDGFTDNSLGRNRRAEKWAAGRIINCRLRPQWRCRGRSSLVMVYFQQHCEPLVSGYHLRSEDPKKLVIRDCRAPWCCTTCSPEPSASPFPVGLGVFLLCLRLE